VTDRAGSKLNYGLDESRFFFLYAGNHVMEVRFCADTSFNRAMNMESLYSLSRARANLPES